MTLTKSACLWAALLMIFSLPATAATLTANPGNYDEQIDQLQPGDTLQLTSGDYPRLTLSDLNGTPSAWITIEGPADHTARITAESCCNTVQIRRSSYLALKSLHVDSGGIDGLDGINAKDGPSHHIVVENNLITGVGGGQQTVGISTKSIAWDWQIRGNIISEAGTGIYLGDSNGAAPFISGVIEGNLVLYPEGYAMQIKHQNRYSAAEAPQGDNVTIIRHNIFVKDGRPSRDGARPNLLVGPFPDQGQGSGDRYEIYGNLLYDNPAEALLQASGTVAIHDNLMVNSAGAGALYLTDHNGPLRAADVYHNTILSTGSGIYFASQPRDSHLVVGNTVFAASPISGRATEVRDNVTGAVADASRYLTNPVFQLPGMDLYPKSGELHGAAVSLPPHLGGHTDFDRDFNGTLKGSFDYRGAYAGSGANPGWLPALELKPLPVSEAVPKPPVITEDE